MSTSTPAVSGPVSPHPTPVNQVTMVPGHLDREPPDIRHPMDGPPNRIPQQKPSPWWLLCMMPFAAIAVSATLAPRVEIFTTLACRVLRPDIYDPDSSFVMGNTADSSRAMSKIILSHVSSNFLEIHNFSTRGLEHSELIVQGKRCASDPVVQAAVAKLLAIMATSTGILGCLTGAWWGAFCDRHGRTKILGITVIGALLTDLNFILVTLCADKLPGGYWLLLVGPLFEGVLGGLASGTAANHAYLADITTEETRSHFFSLNLGLLYTGIALGPAIGSLLIKATGQVLSVFFLSASIHAAYALLALFVIPESLTAEEMQISRQKHKERLLGSHHDHPTGYVTPCTKRIFQFLSPLTILIPSGKNRKDWSLTLIGLVYGLTYILLANTQSALQYMASSFGWSSETTGYYISLMGAIRALHLMVIIPVLIKYVKPEPRVALEVPPEEEPLLGPNMNSDAVRKELHSLSFDVTLARVSMAMEAVAYGAMGLSSSGFPFVVSSVFLWLGSAVNPAIQSVALAIYKRNGGTESGRLFGALSVVQALSSQIIGPSLFGFVYANTVAWFPQGIFFVSGISLVLAFLCLFIIRVPKDIHETDSDDDVAGLDRGEEGTGEPSLIPEIRITGVED